MQLIERDGLIVWAFDAQRIGVQPEARRGDEDAQRRLVEVERIDGSGVKLTYLAISKCILG